MWKGVEAKHLPLNIVKWMFQEREQARALVSPEGINAVCHRARATRPVNDPRTPSLQVSCDSPLGPWVQAAASPHICIPSCPVHPTISLCVLLQNADACAWATNEMRFGVSAKGVTGLGMRKSNMLPRQQSMGLLGSRGEREKGRGRNKWEQLP